MFLMGYEPKDTLTYFLHFSAICHHSRRYLRAACSLLTKHTASTQPPRTALTHDFQGDGTIRLIVAIVDDIMSAEPSTAHDSLRSSSTAHVALSDTQQPATTHGTHWSHTIFQGEYDQVDCCLLRSLIWALSLRWLMTARVAHRQLALLIDSSLARRCFSQLAELVDSSRSLSVAHGACWQLVYA